MMTDNDAKKTANLRSFLKARSNESPTKVFPQQISCSRLLYVYFLLCYGKLEVFSELAPSTKDKRFEGKVESSLVFELYFEKKIHRKF